MYAPKPAICGNGHAAMIRTWDADTHLMVEEKKSRKQPEEKTKKPKKS